MNSILAGIMIAVAATAYLSVGGIAGACLFSLGLMTILVFKWDLFTGKAGLLATGEIKIGKLIKIWFGNLFGVFIGVSIVLMSPIGEGLSQKAQEILAIRNANPPFMNFLLGIGCGLLMYIAVNGFARSGSYLFVIFPVMSFILIGFNHCVADMCYICMACRSFSDFSSLIGTTFGNVLGCCAVPLLTYFHRD